MIQINDVNELNKICRNALIAQSGLQPQFVRNGLSLYGNPLDKNITASIFQSIDVTDEMIIFQLRSRESSNDVSFTDEETDDIIYTSSYEMYVIIYGNNSKTLANSLVARFRSEAAREHFYSKGVYLESVSNPSTINEFINDTMWLRSDFSIDISCESRIAQMTNDYIIASTDYKIIKEE